MVAAFVERNHGTSDDAEDMLQEALVVLWERVRSGKFEYSAKLSTFIFGTVKNLWSRRLVKMRREISDDFTDNNHANGEETLLEGFIRNESVDLMRRAMERLGEQCRKLLLLFYWEELSMEQIASEMNFANAATVKSKKYQCKKELEKMAKELGME
jgi:RNA polymerase sigma factor (sigma-70 family)